MSVEINENTMAIVMTRGDTLNVEIGINDSSGENEYTPSDEDVIKFSVRKDFEYTSLPLIQKVIPNDTLLLHLDPEDTKSLEYGTYYYDVQITLSDGTVCTFIPSKPKKKAKFTLTEEVTL